MTSRAASVRVSILMIFVLCVTAPALVMTDAHGRWPTTWPASLESLRERSRTIEVATGLQENIYEIPFTDRAEFERLWPDLLALKTPGAPLRLLRANAAPPKEWGSLLSNATPCVRVYGPGEGVVDGTLNASAPWPKALCGPKGELPEYVRAVEQNGAQEWAAADPKSGVPTFYHRARVDVELVVDGQVIDLNRIRLPADGPVDDRRF